MFWIRRKKSLPDWVLQKPVTSWAVVYDPSIDEERPYYVELRINSSARGGGEQWFKTESEAVEYAEQCAAKCRRREDLKKTRRVVHEANV